MCIQLITIKNLDIDAWEFWDSAKQMKESIANEMYCHVLWRHQNTTLQNNIYRGAKSLFRADATEDDIMHWVLQTVADPSYDIDRRDNVCGMYRYTILKTYYFTLNSLFK